MTEPAFAAIKFKRFPHRPDATATMKTCEFTQAGQAAIIFVMPEIGTTPIQASVTNHSRSLLRRERDRRTNRYRVELQEDRIESLAS